MEYRGYDDEEMAELLRERPVTREELNELLKRLEVHCEKQTKPHRVSGQVADEQVLTAANDAVMNMTRSIERKWAATGMARLWDVSWQRYRKAYQNAMIDFQRREARHQPPTPADDDGDGWHDDYRPGTHRVREVGQHGHEPDEMATAGNSVPFVDDEGLVETNYHLPVQAQQRLIFPPILAVIATRTLRVMEARSRKPQLTEQQATIGRHLQEFEWSIASLTFTELEEAAASADRLRWRRRLAAKLDLKDRAIAAAVSVLADAVRLGNYLFYVLAPPDDAVVDLDVMDRLLDAVHIEGEGLKPTERMLLRKAGVSLESVRRLQVSREAFLVQARKLGRLADHSDREVLGELHSAELNYAVLVPGQGQPPVFRCVLACRTHKAASEVNHG